MIFAICDDSMKEIALIRHFLSEHFHECIIEEFSNGGSLVKYLKSNIPDIVFLDIEMPGINGLETAKAIRESRLDIGIIFITGHSSYALKAFEVYAYDYILKPVSRERLIGSVNRILKERVESEKFICIKNQGTMFRVNQNDILFVEKNYNRCIIHTARFEYSMRAMLKYFSERLDSGLFIKTHSGFIVNKTKIASLTPRGNLSYEIRFYGSDKKALLSRGMRDKLDMLHGMIGHEE